MPLFKSHAMNLLWCQQGSSKWFWLPHSIPFSVSISLWVALAFSTTQVHRGVHISCFLSLLSLIFILLFLPSSPNNATIKIAFPCKSYKKKHQFFLSFLFILVYMDWLTSLFHPRTHTPLPHHILCLRKSYATLLKASCWGALFWCFVATQFFWWNRSLHFKS